MSRVVKSVELVLDRVLLVLFSVMVVAIVYQVFARYVLNSPTVWSEELARFLMVAITMLGSALVVGRKGHVAVTVFVEMLPEPLQRIVAAIRDLLVVTMGGVLAYYGYGFAIAGGRRTSSGLDVPMLYPYSAIGLGGLLIALFIVFRHIRREVDPS